MAVPYPEDKEEVKKHLDTIFDHFERLEKSSRDNEAIEIKRRDNFWEGRQALFFDDIARDFKTARDVFDMGLITEDELEDYERVINIYKSHGESIISASSIEVPHVWYFPSDASNPVDILAAKGYQKLGAMIEMRAGADYLVTQMYSILYRQSFVATYTYYVESKEYGVTYEPKGEMQPFEIEKEICPDCGDDVQPVDINPDLSMEFDMESEEQIEPQNLTECPSCGYFGEPETLIEEEFEFVETDVEEIPKGRQIIEVYGPKNVYIPFGAKKQAEIPFLCLEQEVPIPKLRSVYGDRMKSEGSADDEKYNRYVRRPSEEIEANVDNATLRRIWIRPWAYYALQDKAMIEMLEQHYPDGVKMTKIEDEVIDCENESLDEYWTLDRHPLTDNIRLQPIGDPIMPIQEMFNELIQMTMETIKHQMSETFADPDVVDFNLYKNTEQAPGSLFPAKGTPGQPLAQAFFQTSHASLSREVDAFRVALDQYGQFVLGSFPSIFGGIIEGGSKTAQEYETSRQMALQRLGLAKKAIDQLWADTMRKATICYKKNMKDDEQFTSRDGGHFNSIWIKKEELSGEIGEVIPEASGQFPMTWTQKRTMLFETINSGNEQFNATIFHPENTTFVKSLSGFHDMYVPGSLDRERMLWKIKEMLKTEPEQQMQLDDFGDEVPMMQPTMQPDPRFEDMATQVETIKAWALSDNGMDAMENNQGGFQNVMLYLQMAQGILSQQQMQMMPMQDEQKQESRGGF